MNTSHICLKQKDTSKLKSQIIKYLKETFAIEDNLFSILKDDEYFYKQPNKLRHALIFYYAHTAVFYINKLMISKIINTRLDKDFEAHFAIGVDEMNWDNLNQKYYKKQNIQKVKQYRKKVLELLLKTIEDINITQPILYNSDIYTIIMGIEHQNIHIETSSVLLRELDIKYIDNKLADKNIDIKNTYPKNDFINIPSCNVKLEKDINDIEYYGWDNEFGKCDIYVKEFSTSKYLVSHGEFLEFVNDGGYENDKYWDDEGAKFKNSLKEKLPRFWIKKDDEYYLREIDCIVKLPLNHPVIVNNHEASAFCKYKSEKLNEEISLPSEEEYISMYNFCKDDIKEANINIANYQSVPVDTHKTKDLYDVVGNVWQLCDTPIYPFVGFKPHKDYDDFSLPTFDDKHFLLKGGSFISRGNVAMPLSRYAFRKYFYQHSGFRYVKSSNTHIQNRNKNIYENDELINQYCDFHYGDECFGVKNFMKHCVDIVIKIANQHNTNTDKVMDLGCSVGRGSFELAKYFKKVVSIDFSANFINMAIDIKNKKSISYKRVTEGSLYAYKNISFDDISLDKTKNNIEFMQGDACNLNSEHKNYDVIFCANLIDRLYDPYIFLQSIQKRVNKNSLLVIISPFTWLEEYTPKEKWLGGFKKDNKEIYTKDNIANILSNFELIHSCDVDFVIRETSRKHQHSTSHMMIFKKIH